ncbi:integrating conjugative element protein [Klebsiella variicola]|uniref:integrating conjugative element protein n=1 Tax=Klebsiella variicola TaxID=244366 RepID=UPI001CCE0697|nr:integrating conjugative element protein [Klebsiella variicola]MBZ7597063.1 integrating conjugative element protein [Klebsiella variicola]
MKSIYLLGLCCLFGNAQAGLNVIADLGGEPAAPYFDGINNQPNEIELPSLPDKAALPAAPASLASVLPISTPELTPGNIEARRLDLPGMQPIFLLGNDPMSRRWLDERKESLRQLRAVGFVVNIENAAAFGELQALGGDVELLPVSGSDLAKRLGLQHYPVLISEKGIEQ